jgi:hypothetical protein
MDTSYFVIYTSLLFKSAHLSCEVECNVGNPGVSCILCFFGWKEQGCTLCTSFLIQRTTTVVVHAPLAASEILTSVDTNY